MIIQFRLPFGGQVSYLRRSNTRMFGGIPAGAGDLDGVIIVAP
jgi:hypothetical protein